MSPSSTAEVLLCILCLAEMKSTEWKRCVPGVREVRYGRCLGCAPSGHACDLLYPAAVAYHDLDFSSYCL